MSAAEARTARPQQHQRSKSTFSFRSNTSEKSQKAKIDLRETPSEKARRHLSTITKANPNAAMNEAQPIAAAYEDVTITSLRSMQHKDDDGTVINDPDLSNPTRYRWERPLDTIKSFEASIDTAYQRKSMMAPDPRPHNRYSMVSRPRSYYAGSEHPSAFGHRYSQQPIRNSFRDYADNGLGGLPPLPMPGPGGRRPRQHPRFQSEPYIPNNRLVNGGYPHQSPNLQQRMPEPIESRSNGSPSEPWASSTDPSSENSSIERNKMDPNDQVGGNAYGQASASGSGDMANYSNLINYNRTRTRLNGEYGAAPQEHSAPRIPQHAPQLSSQMSHMSQASQMSQPGRPEYPEGGAVGGLGKVGASAGNGGQKKIIKLSSSQSSQVVPSVSSATNDKRKSWLKRRFSKVR